jgi:hypothetical protein
VQRSRHSAAVNCCTFCSKADVVSLSRAAHAR